VQDKCSGYPSTDKWFLKDDIEGGKAPLEMDVSKTKVLLGLNDRDGLSMAPPFSFAITTNVSQLGNGSVINLWSLESGENTSDGEEALLGLLAQGTYSIPAFYLDGFPGFGAVAAREIVDIYSKLPLPSNTLPPYSNWTRILWAVQRDVINLCPTRWLAQQLMAANAKATYPFLYWTPPNVSSPAFCSGSPTAHSCELSLLWSNIDKPHGGGFSTQLAKVWQDTIGSFVRDEASWEPADPSDPSDMKYLNLTFVSHVESGYGKTACAYWDSYIKRGPKEEKAFYAFAR